MQNTLKLNEIERFLFVINPIAGAEDNKGEFLELVESESKVYGWTYKTYETTGKNDPAQVKKIIESYDPEAVIAVGGDGTVNMVAHILAGTGRVFGIIPGGSGNGLSKDLRIPQNNFKAAFEILLHGQVKEIDTLKANEHFFMHLADIGFNAHIVKLFSKSKSRGLLTYMKFVLKEFYKYPVHYYKIETDNGSYSGRAFMITIANSNQFGSNLTINPDGDWSDGKFEVIIIKPFPKNQSLMLFLRLLTKKIKFSPYCIILKCTKAKITCKNKRSLQYDGEIGKKVREANFSIKHRNLKIIVP